MGAGRNNSENSHASVILTEYATYVQGIKCLIDSSKDLWGKTFLDYPIIPPKEIKDNQIELIIIASKNSSDSIKKSISEHAPECEVLDIYDELRKRGIEVYQKFFQESGVYTKIFFEKDNYIKETQALKKAHCLREVIALYLHIFDFYYAEKFSLEYIKNKYSGYMDLENMWKEIHLVLDEVKKINAAKIGDVIIHFIDSLRAVDIFKEEAGTDNPVILKSYLKNAAVFSNAYATGPTTYESVMGIIGKKHSFEKNVYENNFMFDFDEFGLLRYAEIENMHINIFNSPGYKIIKETNRADFIPQIYMSEKLWSIASTIAASKKKTFNFIYYPGELHFPLLCGFHKNKPQTGKFSDVGMKDMSSYIEGQFGECLDYVDKQFEYYKGFYGEGITQIFFSDHSQVIYDKEKQSPYYTYYNNPDRCVHVAFFAVGGNIKPKNYTHLCSMIDFNQIADQLLRSGSSALPDRKFIRYQYYNIHNQELREAAMQRDFMDYVDGMICCMSDEYIYVITNTRKKELYEKVPHGWRLMETHSNSFTDEICSTENLSFPDFLKPQNNM